MKGDFTRLTFNRKKQYNSVRMQQGRVQLDSDWNEQVDIQNYLARTQSGDIIGNCGVPKVGGGFKISKIDGDLVISPGRIYVDGLLCENIPKLDGDNNPQTITYLNQPSFFSNDLLSDAPGLYLAYLDVWERHVTAVEDYKIREVALGGPDTATRMQTIWQVKLVKLDEPLISTPVSEDDLPVNDKDNLPPSCWNVPSWETILGKPNRTLKARIDSKNATDKPCIVPAAAGYRRLENQLYRVEIHEKLTDNNGNDYFTFKWSRDNGIVATRLLSINATNNRILTVAEVGKDAVLSFAPGQWVEITDDTRVLNGEPGVIVQIDYVEDNNLTIKKWPGDIPFVIDVNQENTAIVRRWDHKGRGTEDLSTTGGAIPVALGEANEIELEDGVKITFNADSPTSFKTGDYWLIPARVVGADIEWPQNSNGPLALPPHGIKHHYCRLALVRWDGTKLSPLIPEKPRYDEYAYRKTFRLAEEFAELKEFSPKEFNLANRLYVRDCRPLFPTLTEPDLYYVSGDGQEAMPGKELPQPLRVGVVNCNRPVIGAWVKFEIEAGGGILLPDTSMPGYVELETNPQGITAFILPTDEIGEVKTSWKLEELTPQKLDEEVTEPKPQLVKATLLKSSLSSLADSPENQLDIPVLFGASFGVAWENQYGGACFPDKKHPQGIPLTVEDVLDQLRENISLYCVSGDGQEVPRVQTGMEDRPGLLPHPLEVRVANGDWPFANAVVKFSTDSTGGLLSATNQFDESNTFEVEVPTGPDGVARCYWRLNADTDAVWSQHVTAEIVSIGSCDDSNKPWSYNSRAQVHFNANLSIAEQVTYDGSRFPEKIHDSLTAVTVEAALDQLRENVTLYYVSGDGQEAIPGSNLPQPLQVRVANNDWPYPNAVVLFTITPETGGDGTLYNDDETGKEIRVKTNSAGLAECIFKLDEVNQSQQVTAIIESAGELVFIPESSTVRFNATTSKANQVFYDPSGTKERWVDINDDATILPPENVQTAIDNIVSNMESGDIGYNVPAECLTPPDKGVPVFKDLLDVKGATNIKALWNKLLCSLDAAKVPYTPNNKIKRWLDILDEKGSKGLPITVQMAIDSLVENLESSDIRYEGRNVKDVLDELVDISKNVAVPTGTVIAYSSSTPPGGWLECNGQAISRTGFALLFKTISTTYGVGDGETTFNMPDLRGEFIRGWDSGSVGGRGIGSSQGHATALPRNGFATHQNTRGAHAHFNSHHVSEVGNLRGGSRAGGLFDTRYTPVNGSIQGSGGIHDHTIAGGDSETRPQNVALMYCVKY